MRPKGSEILQPQLPGSLLPRPERTPLPVPTPHPPPLSAAAYRPIVVVLVVRDSLPFVKLRTAGGLKTQHWAVSCKVTLDLTTKGQTLPKCRHNPSSSAALPEQYKIEHLEIFISYFKYFQRYSSSKPAPSKSKPQTRPPRGMLSLQDC